MFTKEKNKDNFNNKNKRNNQKAREDLFDVLDKTPIATLLTFNAEELFEIQEQASFELEKANYRKKWIDGVIELKYKSTIESSYKRAVEYFNTEPFKEMDKYNSELLTDYINDGNSIVKVEFYRIKQIKDKERDKNIEWPQIKKRFSLIKTSQINTSQTDENKINNSGSKNSSRTDGGCYGNK